MKKTKLRPGLSKAVKSRKADKRQNPPARASHKAGVRKSRASAAKTKRRPRAPKAVPPAPREVGLLDAIGEVMADVEELGQELRDWADNMPENQQGGDKHSQIEEAADTLETCAGNDPVEPDRMTFINAVKITIQDPTPRRRGYSRSARLGHAQGVLMDVIEKLGEEIGDLEGPNEVIMGELRDALEEIDADLQGVEFPGMFG